MSVPARQSMRRATSCPQQKEANNMKVFPSSPRSSGVMIGLALSAVALTGWQSFATGGLFALWLLSLGLLGGLRWYLLQVEKPRSMPPVVLRDGRSWEDAHE